MIDIFYLKNTLRFSEYQIKRTMLMKDLAEEISNDNKTKLILKGGTALLLCYGLPRFSTDLDYDGEKHGIDIIKNIEIASKKNKINPMNIIIKKDTQTVKRYMLHYKEEPDKPLKIEISFRNTDFITENQNIIVNKNGIRVYDINTLSGLKIDAFINRYTARDIYDIEFLLRNYPDSIKKEQITVLREKCKSLGVDYLEKQLKEDDVFKSTDCSAIPLSIEEMLNKKSRQPHNNHKSQKHDSWYER